MSSGNRSYTLHGIRFEVTKPEPGLYIAATPIGNLGDITIRVLETLAGCDLVACEDTRVTGKLLNHFGIKKRLISYHEHNRVEAGGKIITALKQDESVVLTSDAGTPLVSDPGMHLVSAVREEKVPIFSLPGPTAPVAALVSSGLPSEMWTFLGFLPSGKASRIAKLESLRTQRGTMIFFESPNRIARTLSEFRSVFGADRPAAVARELTKLHEETLVGTLFELEKQLENRKIKGEIVLLLGPSASDEVPDPRGLMMELLQRMSVSEAASEAAKLIGIKKRDAYKIALELRDGT